MPPPERYDDPVDISKQFKEAAYAYRREQRATELEPGESQAQSETWSSQEPVLPDSQCDELPPTRVAQELFCAPGQRTHTQTGT